MSHTYQLRIKVRRVVDEELHPAGLGNTKRAAKELFFRRKSIEERALTDA